MFHKDGSITAFNHFYCKKHERGGLSCVGFLLAQLLSASVVLVGEVQARFSASRSHLW